MAEPQVCDVIFVGYLCPYRRMPAENLKIRLMVLLARNSSRLLLKKNEVSSMRHLLQNRN